MLPDYNYNGPQDDSARADGVEALSLTQKSQKSEKTLSEPFVQL